VLVTGAAGFIGSHLCERLVREGFQVTGLDNFNRFYSPTVKRRNLATLETRRGFRLVRGDIRARRSLDEALGRGVDCLVHLAAMAGVRPSMESPALYQSVNVEGTVQVLEAARAHGVPHVVFGSSSSVYGNGSRVPFREDDPAMHPVSVYAATKRAGELLCHTYAETFGMPITVLRFFTVYGPRQRPDLAIHKFARLMLRAEPVPFFGDGGMERDFTYVDDIVEGVRASLARPRGLRVFNLGSDRPIRLDRLLAMLEQTLGVKARLQRHPVPAGDVRRTWADISLARRELGYAPRTSFEEGLKRFVAWLRTAGARR
jgi:UDP-glucuronate 4-epimerase